MRFAMRLVPSVLRTKLCEYLLQLVQVAHAKLTKGDLLPIMIVLTKTDLAGTPQQQVSLAEVCALAAEFGADWAACSALLFEGVVRDRNKWNEMLGICADLVGGRMIWWIALHCSSRYTLQRQAGSERRSLVYFTDCLDNAIVASWSMVSVTHLCTQPIPSKVCFFYLGCARECFAFG
jgi:hypothetical protein